MNQNNGAFLSWMASPSCICFIIKMWDLFVIKTWNVACDWKLQTKQLEAELKSPCFIPQQLDKTVQIKKIKELLSYHMACLACLPFCFFINIANTKTYNVILQYLEFVRGINKHCPRVSCAFRLFWQKARLLLPTEVSSPVGRQNAQLQSCRNKNGPETLCSRRTDTKGMWDKWNKNCWKFLMPWEIQGGKQLRFICESTNQHSFQ